MLARVIVGVVLALIGVVWFLQGIDVAKGSGMSGHPLFAILGVALVVGGLWLVVAGVRRGRTTSDQPQ